MARGSEITALSTPQMRPVRPLLRVGVRPRTCAAKGDGVWAAARACGATERDPGARTCARCVPLWETSIERVAGGLVALGDRPMTSGMASAMVPKGVPLAAVVPRGKKKRLPHHRPRERLPQPSTDGSFSARAVWGCAARHRYMHSGAMRRTRSYAGSVTRAQVVGTLIFSCVKHSRERV